MEKVCPSATVALGGEIVLTSYESTSRFVFQIRKKEYMEIKNMADEIKQGIISDHLAGVRLKDISEKYGILGPRIIRLLKKEGCFKPSTNRWTESEIKYLQNNYSCASWKEIEKRQE